MKVQINVRLEENLIEELRKIAEIEKKKTGYNVTTSSVISKVLTDFISSYKK